MTDSSVRLEPYGLGPALNQCCGGSVELLFEVMTTPAPEWLTKLLDATEHGDPAVLATATAGAEKRHYVALPVGRESELPEALQMVVREMLDSAADGTIRTVTAHGCDWWLERIAKNRRPVWIFGAGHVGKAVVKALADLPFKVRWLDGREDVFPAQIPGNAMPVKCADLPGEVSQAPSDTTFVVMTHSHDLDEEICHAVLERGDFAFLGMIGSVSKRRRFAHRLGKRGIENAALDRLICPVGLPGIEGKEPATIALSLAAQLMSEKEIR
jgi:xanthine dehydrogenase accessory factor